MVGRRPGRLANGRAARARDPQPPQARVTTTDSFNDIRQQEINRILARLSGSSLRDLLGTQDSLDFFHL
jgi:hypothetical protein